MRLLGKTAVILGIVGAMALGSITASQARWRAGPAAAGFVAGAVVGAAAANANAAYYGSGGYGYDSYAYEPAYVEPGYGSPSYYGPVTGYDNSYSYGSGYNTNYTGPWQERRLEGRD